GGHREAVRKVAFSADGKTLYSVGTDKTLRAWDAATGAERGRSTVLATSTAPVAFRPDGKALVTSARVRPKIAFDEQTQADRVLVWDPATGNELRRFDDRFLQVHTVAFSPGGNLLALAGHSDRVFLWETATGNELQRFDNGRINRGVRSGCLA